jgi:hypothetical protein
MQQRAEGGHKIPREMRKEQGVAETNAGVANAPLLNQKFGRKTYDSNILIIAEHRRALYSLMISQ